LEGDILDAKSELEAAEAGLQQLQALKEELF
jgi:hypothetical protein